jgi:hypothetical protein|tara:strand:- start:687 stop:1142 length:456 start_codon:yes stop_codon:yes gene_type:complete
MAYITGMDITEVSDTSTFKLGQLGQTEDGKIYKYVQYDTGSGSVAAVSGNVAYYYTLDGYKNNSVTSDLSDSIELGAGVLQSAPTDGQYCWIQVRGAATLTTALTAGTDGDPLTPTGSSDGTLDLATAITDNICAFAGDISDKEVACDFLL